MGSREKIIVSVAALLLIGGVGAPTRAQEATAPNPYGGLLDDRTYLTGNWNGVRDDLAAHGVTFLPSVTGFYQGPTAGNVAPDFVSGGKAEFFLNVDGSKLGLWNGFAIVVHGETNFGQTPGAVGGTVIPNNTAMTFPYQNQNGGDLTTLRFMQRFGQNLAIIAGKSNMFDFYAAGHKFSGGRGIEGFWNTMFVGPPSGIVPVAAFGAIANYKIDPLSFTLMVYDPTDAINHTGFECPFCAGVTVRGSTDITSQFFGLPRLDSFMAAVSSQEGTDFTTLPDLSKYPGVTAGLIHRILTQALWGQDIQIYLPPDVQAVTAQKRGRWWLGYSFEQTLWQDASNPSESWGLFGQVGVSDGNPNAEKWSAIAGVGGNSPLSTRPYDKFGVGLFYYGYSDLLKRELAPLVTLGDEYGMEAFYNVALTKWFKVSADAQVIAPSIKAQTVDPAMVNPTVANNSTVMFVGLRGQVSF
jgi:porin